MIKVVPNTRAAARLLHEGALALSTMENNGIRVDVGYLAGLIEKTEKDIAAIETQLTSDKVWREWRRAYGAKANLGSRAQLADLVFDKLGYEKAEGKKNKQRSEDSGDSYKKESKHDEASFAIVAKELPFVKTYFQCEKLKKMLSTYLYGIRREMVDGFVHPVYNLNIAISYRSTCDTPNFQNIPIRNKTIAEMVRRCYVPREGNHFSENDYGGIEVKVSACYNGDRNLIKYIKDPSTDMHRDMAAFIFKMNTKFLTENKDWAKKTVRDWAKNRLVFPMFYGSVWAQCAPDLWRAVLQHWSNGEKMPDGKTSIRKHLKNNGIDGLGPCGFDEEPRKGTFAYRIKEAETYLWETMFPEYTQWKKDWYAQYLKRGWFAMHTGFVVEALLKKNDVLNYSIQGSAFHCTLQAMIWIQQELKRLKMKTKLVGQIHDCIIADVPPKELQDYLTMCREIMVNRLTDHWKWINVPMETESEVCEVNESWFYKRVWTNQNGVWQLPPKK